MKVIRNISETYVEAFEWVLNIIKNRVVDIDTRHILIVPDKYTMYAEKAIYCSGSGAIDCSVTTFNRLVKNLACVQSDAIKNLPRDAGIMLVKKLCQKHKSQFHAYRHSAGFKGFGQMMYNLIQQLKSCKLSYESLREHAQEYLGLSVKLNDIALIFEKYQNTIVGKFYDSEDRFELLKTAIMEGQEFNNCHVYICNFDYYSPIVQDLIDTIGKHLLSLTISDTKNLKTTHLDTLEVYEAMDQVDEIKYLARTIKALTIRGVKYNDIGIVYNADTTVLMRIFKEYDIPINIDLKHNLSSFPLSVYIVNILNACLGLRQNIMISLAKNPFSNLNLQDTLVFCKYVYKYGVDFNGFENTFDDSIAESVRLHLINQINEFKLKVYDCANTAVDFCNAMYDFLSQKTLDIVKLDKLTDIDCVQFFKKIVAIVDNLLLIVDKNDSKTLAINCFLDGLNTTLSILPVEQDAVMVGQESVFRGQTYDTIFIASFNEEIRPMVLNDNNIITDSEIIFLQQSGLNYQPSIKLLNDLAKQELLQLVYSGAKIRCSYISTINKKPSFLLKTIINNSSVVDYTNMDLELALINSTAVFKDKFNAVDNRLEYIHDKFFSSFCSSVELLVGDKVKDNALASALYLVLKEKNSLVDNLLYPKSGGLLDNARELCFNKNTTSISAIENFYSCPFKYFLSKVGLKDIEMAKNAPNDLGTFLHKVLEQYISSNQNYTMIDSIIDNILAQKEFYKMSLKSNAYIKDRAITESKKVCRIVSMQLSQSLFSPIGVEVRFGNTDNKDKDDCCMQGVKFGEIELMGVIDRVDMWQNFIRLIDYKSGQVMSSFDYTDIYFGIKLQLLMYLSVFLNQGYRVAGSFYFPIKDNWNDDEFSHKLVGVYNSDPQIVEALDKNMSSNNVAFDSAKTKKSTVIDAKLNNNKQGVKLVTSKAGLHEMEIDGLVNYCKELVAKAINQIIEGNIDKAPFSKKGKVVCEYCPYYIICKASGQDINERHIQNTLELNMFLNMQADNGYNND